MKVLQVNCVYNTGSTGKIMCDIHTELLKNGHESVICYGRGAKTSDKNVYKTCGELYSKFNNLFSRFTGIMYGGCFFSTNRLIRIIKKEKPDIVHLHCINGYFVNIYRLISWLKKNRIKTVLTLHAEFMHTANCGHALECEKWQSGCGNCPRLKKETKSLFIDNTALSFKKMKKAFEGFNENLIVVSVSPWLMDRAKRSDILSDKNHTVVFNGLDTNIFHIYDNSVSIKEKYDLTNEKVIFHATPFFSNDKEHIKGGYYVIELAKKLQQENVKIIVAGDYQQDIQVLNNILFLGRTSNQIELAELYSMADVTLLTSKKETFSMVTAESLCCGTPVVGFKAGGPETIALDDFCDFVDYGNINALEAKIIKWIENDYNASNISKSGIEKYQKQQMTYNYLKVYQDLLK